MVRRDNNDYVHADANSSWRSWSPPGFSVLEIETFQPNGRFALTRAASVLSTRAALPSRRFRLALFVDNKWRREGRDLKILPRAVILKRFATDLRVLLRAMGFGIGGRS